MSFNIAHRHLLGFKIWLELLGYRKRTLPDGGCTFNGKGTKLDYVLVTKDLSGNNACRILYAEYRGHLSAPDISTTDVGLQQLHNTIMGKRTT